MTHKIYSAFISALFVLNTFFIAQINAQAGKINCEDITDQVSYSGGLMDSIYNVTDTEFLQNISYTNVEFLKEVFFSSTTFEGFAHFDDAVFCEEAWFTSAKFKCRSKFTAGKFFNPTYMSRIEFLNQTDFQNVEFKDSVTFEETIFSKYSNFSGTKFSAYANFKNAKFLENVSFVNARFKKSVSLENTKFVNRLDLRRVSLEDVENFYLEGLSYPPGKLFVYWHQLRAKDSLRIKLMNADEIGKEEVYYRRIESIYHQLRDNYLLQRNLAAADDVMYELGEQKANLLGGIRWRVYGWVYGWGYKPLRSLFVVFIILVAFTFLWHCKYHEEVRKIWAGDKTLTPHSVDKIYWTESPRISSCAELWYMFLFSSSLFFSFRFQKEWMKTDVLNESSKWFFFWTFFEWTLGTLFYVSLFLFLKSARFEFIKGFLGF